MCNLHCRTRHTTHLSNCFILNWHCVRRSLLALLAGGSHYRGGRHRRWIKQIIAQCHKAGRTVVMFMFPRVGGTKNETKWSAWRNATTNRVRPILFAPTEWHRNSTALCTPMAHKTSNITHLDQCRSECKTSVSMTCRDDGVDNRALIWPARERFGRWLRSHMASIKRENDLQ